MTVIRSLKCQLVHMLDRSHGSAIAKKIYNQAKQISEALENHNFEIDSNGETWLMERLAQSNMDVVLDCGANKGEWSELVLNRCPIRQLHVFEIVPTTAQRCELHLKAIAKDSKKNPSCSMCVNPFGLSNSERDLTIWHSEKRSVLSSIERRCGNDQAELHCHVERGDDYLKKRNIECVDFLKIDVEGHEIEVLEGMGNYVADGKIRVIQFEYASGLVADAKSPERVASLLKEYRIGRLFPDGVYFFGHNLIPKDHRNFNYVAVRKSETDIITLLSDESRGHYCGAVPEMWAGRIDNPNLKSG